MPQNLYYMWSDDYFISCEENREFEEALQYRSDDYIIVNIIEFDDWGNPIIWDYCTGEKSK